MFRITSHLVAATLCGAFMTFVGVESLAGPSGEVFSPNRFGVCNGPGGDKGCPGVYTDVDGFNNFTRELGVATSMYALQPASTTGQNGFAIQLNMTNTTIQNDKDYWSKRSAFKKGGEGEPSGMVKQSLDEMAPASLSVMNLQVRKGLPMSLELGLNAGIVTGDAEFYTLGGQVKYALNEDWIWPVPDLAVRAWGNVVFGSHDFDVFNFGGDVILSLPIGLGGTVQLTPIAGYSLQVVASRSNVLDADPSNPHPPVIPCLGDSSGGTCTPDPNNPNYLPEYVFASNTQILHRVFVGLQLQVAVIDLNFQASFLGDQLTLGGGLGVDF